MEAVTLTAGDVLLRPTSAADLDDMVTSCQDPEFQRWTSVPVPYELRHAQEWVAKMIPEGSGWQLGTNPGWAISRTGEPTAYDGFIDLRLDERRAAEVGYSVAPWARGRGVATTALRRACAFAFDDLGLTRVSWYAAVGNDASRRVAEKAGFRILDGHLRRLLPTRGDRPALDAWVGDLLPEDLSS